MALAAALFLPCFLRAAEGEHLQVDLLPVIARPRTAAPLPVNARLKWDGTRLLEGRLELDLSDGTQLLGIYHSPELALTDGEQNVRMLLPALEPSYTQQVDVRMRFVTAKETIELPPTVLFVSPMDERSLVIALCEALAAFVQDRTKSAAGPVRARAGGG